MHLLRWLRPANKHMNVKGEEEVSSVVTGRMCINYPINTVIRW